MRRSTGSTTSGKSLPRQSTRRWGCFVSCNTVVNSSPRPPPTSRRTAKKYRTPTLPGGASGLAPAPAAALALAFFVQAAPRRVAVAGVPGTVGRARGLLRSAGASHTRVGPRGHARSAPGEAFAGGGLLRRSARVAFTPTVAVVALTIVRGAAPVITVVAVRAVLLGGAAAVECGVGPQGQTLRGARLCGNQTFG